MLAAHRARRGLDERHGEDVGQQAEGHAERGEEHRAQPQGGRRLVGVPGRRARLPEERPPGHEPGRRRHEGAPREAGDHQEVPRARRLLLRLVEELLRHEAEEGGQPRHRQGGGHDGEGGERHGPREPAEEPHVARARLVVDRPHPEEERRLVEGVDEQEHHRRPGRELGRDAHEHGQRPERAQRREGEQALEVGLAVGEDGPGDEGRGAGEDHEVVPGVGPAEGGVEAGEEVDPRLHHRGRVQVRAHRARRGHGARAARSGRGTGPTS